MTREELFDLIWAEGVAATSRRLGVSGSYLARVCTALEVPRPKPGHWGLQSVGRAPPTPPLPPPSSFNPGSWSRGTSERGFIKPLYTRVFRNQSAAEPQAEHPLVSHTRRHLEAAATRIDDLDEFLRLPNKFQRADVTVSRRGLPSALEFADRLFMALEARGHHVVIAGSFQKLARVSIDPRESASSGRRQREEFLVAARQPTVVYIGSIPVGLAIVETSKVVTVQYAGYGKFVPVTEWKGRHVGYTWSTVKEMPTGCFRLLAYDPSRSGEWRQQWRELKPGELIGRVEEIARGLERAAKRLAAKN
ncbi:hypothetical protein QC756_13310 [Sinorhizobium meliloti]|uniref:hypothetical protein n=1 Tax=Rhizobium meliloti TaxID=382 RepID=UPI00244DC883|nr:hypothetical protein [Sinorhizobium meliloti]WGI73343.1 hypothetical protein QC756_13310 [Sinorhizobium meliloti]